MFKKLIELLTGDTNRSRAIQGFLIGTIASQIVVKDYGNDE